MKSRIVAVALTFIPALAIAAGKPIPLSKVVSTFLVSPGSAPEWSMGASASTPEILWKSVGVETQECGSFSSCRRGTARISVAGKELQNLRQRLEPVQWELFMASSGLAKFGPEQMSISPSCDTVSCEFDFEQAMAGSGVAIRRLCHAGSNPFRQTAYALAQGQRRAVTVIGQNSGSGGESTDLTFFFTSDPASQDWCAEARAME
ncbi:hypothetical protein GGR75_003006 [Xanthomonas campestris]|uniref:hypothetical protein n=2 Tax=Xanthomonas campestris TaxID=339 RepID=UPI002DF9F572|nr:hypothetical protein [Xanthomonas campestris]